MARAQLCVLLALIACAFALAMPAGMAWASEAPNVTKHTQAEIIDYLASSGTSMSDEVTYSVEPVLYNEMGSLSDKTKNSALAMLNNMRYIVGVNPVSLSGEQGNLAQAASFVDYAIGKLTHYPDTDGTQPEGMSDELWQLGVQGASHTNIGWGHSTLTSAICKGWMSDASMNNISTLGHRRWCINPEMSTTGFGMAGSYCAMYSFDSNGSGSQTNVVWPAQQMPVEYFDATMPWSISVGTTISNTSGVKVVLTNKATNESWTFDTLSTSVSSDTSSAYFGVNNEGYGAPGCIIFRPENFSFSAGDVFHVVASGINGSTIEYDVEFFSGYPVESIGFAKDTYYLSYSTALPLTNTPSDASGYEVEWSSSNTDVATVDESGYIEKVGPGETTITATVAGKYTKSGKPITATTKVVVPKPVYDYCNISINSASLEYTGSAIQPTVTVTDKDTGKTLVEGEDYTISLDSEIVEPGDQTWLWVTGKNAYTYSSARSATVQKRTITEDMVELSPSSFVYSGAAQQPTATVSFNGTALTETTDYTVTYSGGKNVGSYTATVKGTGDHFRDSCSKTFEIAAKPLEDSMLSVGASELTYNASEQLPEIELLFNGAALSKGTDYDVSTNETPLAVGSYEMTIQGKGNFEGSLTRSFTIQKATTVVKDGLQVVAAKRLTYGQPLSDLEVSNNTFVAEGTDTEVAGSFGFNDPTTVLDAGTHRVNWTFTPDDSNYSTVEGALDVVVDKATPTIENSPNEAECVYHPTLTLASVALEGATASVEGSWSWADESTALTVPGGEYACVFTPSDSANYEAVNSKVSVKVAKATPVVTAQASGITYGQRLSDSTLTGTAKYSDTDETAVEGSLSWVDGACEPTAAEGNNAEYEALFTPADQDNYESVTVKVTVAVAKATQPSVMPEDEYNVAYATKTLAGVELPEGWAFAESDLSRELNVGETISVTAHYTGADKGNYEKETAEVKVTRSACDHTYGDWVVTLEPTCTAEGTREAECSKCGDKVSESIVALGHSWMENYTVDKPATCTEDGVESFHCSVCGEKKEGSERVIPAGHTWEWKTIKPATCTEEGVERQVCSVCDEELAGSDRAIAMVDHTWGEWKTITEPSTSAEGYKERTCSVCNEVEGATIPKVDAPAKATAGTIPSQVTPTTPAALATVDAQILGAKNDGDPKGSTFSLLQAKGTAKSKTAVKLKWKKVAGATSYRIYGNKCGKANRYKLIKTVGGTSLTLKKLKKGTYYKYLVVAVRGASAIATSKTIHVATKGGKVGNAKKLTVAAKGSKVSLKAGKSFKLKAKPIAQSSKLKMKKHRAVAYETDNPKVATVSSKGAIKAVGKGTCKVYAYAQNGVCKAVKVTVK